MFASIVQLGHRNTRRYGGYIVHFGVAVIIIGFVGSAFQQDKEKEMGFGDKLQIGTYTLVCQSYTQDDKRLQQRVGCARRVPGRQENRHALSERRFYKASQQTATMVAKPLHFQKKTSTWCMKALTRTLAGPFLRCTSIRS